MNRAGSHVESAIPSNRLVLVEIDGTERLYFVVETKFSLLFDELRDQEAAKIECGEAHFKALATSENPAKFMKATNLNDVLSQTELI